MGKTFSVSLVQTNVPKIHDITIGSYHIPICTPQDPNKYPGTTTPHQLFLAYVGVCVNIIFEMACARSHLKLMNLTSDIIGDCETDEKTKRSRFTTIHINTKITVPKGVQEGKIERLFHTACANCPADSYWGGSKVKLDSMLTIKHNL